MGNTGLCFFNDAHMDKAFFTTGIVTTTGKSEGVHGKVVVKAVQKIVDSDSKGQHFTCHSKYWGKGWPS